MVTFRTTNLAQTRLPVGTLGVQPFQAQPTRSALPKDEKSFEPYARPLENNLFTARVTPNNRTFKHISHYGRKISHTILGALIFLGSLIPPMSASKEGPSDASHHSASIENAPENLNTLFSGTSLSSNRDECLKQVSDAVQGFRGKLEDVPKTNRFQSWKKPLITSGIPLSASLILSGDQTETLSSNSSSIYPLENENDPIFRTDFNAYVALFNHYNRNGAISEYEIDRLYFIAQESRIGSQPHFGIRYLFYSLIHRTNFSTYSSREDNLCANWGGSQTDLPCDTTDFSYPKVEMNGRDYINFMSVPPNTLKIKIDEEREAQFKQKSEEWLSAGIPVDVSSYSGSAESAKIYALEHSYVNDRIASLEDSITSPQVVQELIIQLFSVNGMDGYMSLRMGHRLLTTVAFSNKIPNNLKTLYVDWISTIGMQIIYDSTSANDDSGDNTYKQAMMIKLWNEMLTKSPSAKEGAPTVTTSGFLHAILKTSDLQINKSLGGEYIVGGLLTSFGAMYLTSRGYNKVTSDNAMWEKVESFLQTQYCGASKPTAAHKETLPSKISHYVWSLLVAPTIGIVAGTAAEAIIRNPTNDVSEIYFVDMK